MLNVFTKLQKKERKKAEKTRNETTVEEPSSNREPPAYATTIFANRYPVDGLGRKPDSSEGRAFLTKLQHEELFKIDRVDNRVHEPLVVETCSLEMLLANARANAHKCANILRVRPEVMSHQIVGRNGMWPSLEDQIHHSREERDPFSYYVFSKICRQSIEAIIHILSEALVRYNDDPDILWSFLNHQSVSYSTNGKETLDFLTKYVAAPLVKINLEECEQSPDQTFNQDIVIAMQQNARENFYKRRGTTPVCCFSHYSFCSHKLLL